ncbi:MAG: hypothetical protein FWD49_02110 [Firmicutes bacterium]|nr:hypothetical protein [Bacillota bacterium]
MNNQQNQSGKWVPVDEASLGFDIRSQLNGEKKIVTGPDGHQYCVGGAPEMSSIPSNAFNAVPTPSQIIQMPPIIQPIALVPYTSQNQPLLQYGAPTASAPQQPQQSAHGYGAQQGGARAHANCNEEDNCLDGLEYVGEYQKVSYPKAKAKAQKSGKSGVISLMGIVVALVAILILVFMPSFSVLNSIELNAVDSAVALLDMDMEDSDGAIYSEAFLDADNDDIMLYYAVPALVILITVLFLALFIKFIIKLATKKPAGGFSVVALITIILCLALAVVMMLLPSNADVDFAEFLKGDALFAIEAGLYASLGLSIVLFVLPFFAEKKEKTAKVKK